MSIVEPPKPKRLKVPDKGVVNIETTRTTICDFDDVSLSGAMQGALENSHALLSSIIREIREIILDGVNEHWLVREGLLRR